MAKRLALLCRHWPSSHPDASLIASRAIKDSCCLHSGSTFMAVRIKGRGFQKSLLIFVSTVRFTIIARASVFVRIGAWRISHWPSAASVRYERLL